MRPKSLQLVEDDAHDGSPRHAWHLKETPGSNRRISELIQQFDTVFCTAHWEIWCTFCILLSFSCLLIAGKFPISINIRICWRILDVSFFSYLLESASLCSPNLAMTWNILTHLRIECTPSVQKKIPVPSPKPQLEVFPEEARGTWKVRKTVRLVSWNPQRWG